MKKTQTYPQSMDRFRTHVSLSIDTAKKRYDKLHMNIYIYIFLAKLMAKNKVNVPRIKTREDDNSITLAKHFKIPIHIPKDIKIFLISNTERT